MHSARHQGRAAVDPGQRQDAIREGFSGRAAVRRTARPAGSGRDINMPAKEATWTVERVELLKSRFEAGLSCREIAADIGVSRNAVIGKLNRLNLTRDNNGDAPRPARKGAAQGRRRGSVPRLQYRMLMALYAEPQE